MIDEHPKYNNFINEYFKPNKLIYFRNFSLDYSKIPQDCRTNNYLENYNGYIKSKLGKHRLINWVNFINFLKEESQRSIDKLYNATSIEIRNLQIKEQINITNPFLNVNDDRKRIDTNTYFENDISRNSNLLPLL